MEDRGKGRERAILIAGAALCLLPWIGPQIALGAGMALGLLGLVRPEGWSRSLSKWLIQGCVVLLGLRMDLGTLARIGGAGLLFAAGTIALVFIAGFALSRALRVPGRLTTLLSSGTAICGGSAIAAVGAVIGASAAEMSVAIGTVFVLNAAALYAFPVLGQWLAMSPEQFGVWSGVAIHDVSSVVGAAAAFGGGALDTATAVKLSRVIWIAPIALAASWWFTRRGGEGRGLKMSVLPWFVLVFIAASALRTLVPALGEWEGGVRAVAGAGFSTALFLIGAGLNRETLAKIGWRAMAMAVGLWALMIVVSLVVVRSTVE